MFQFLPLHTKYVGSLAPLSHTALFYTTIVIPLSTIPPPEVIHLLHASLVALVAILLAVIGGKSEVPRKGGKSFLGIMGL